MPTELTTTGYDLSGLTSTVQTDIARRTLEIKRLTRRAAEDLVTIGGELTAVKAALPHGDFGPWLDAEFRWTERHARRLMEVADKFKPDKLSGLDFAPSALYLLASDSTPEPARAEAVERATNGERITKGTAKAIVRNHKPEPKTDTVSVLPAPSKTEPAWVETDPEESARISDEEWEKAEAEEAAAEAAKPPATRAAMNAATREARQERRDETDAAAGRHPVDKAINEHIGKLTRAIDERQKLFPSPGQHRAARDAVSAVIRVWQAWKGSAK